MEFFAKIVKSYNYFFKAVRLRPLTQFWIWLSLNKYSLTCRVTSRYELYDTNQNPLYYQKWTYSGIFTSSLDIFSHIVAYFESCVTFAYSKARHWHIENHILSPGTLRTQDIFRTLSRHILAYSECCARLAIWEPCHIQNFAIFRILPYLGLQAYS